MCSGAFCFIHFLPQAQLSLPQILLVQWLVSLFLHLSFLLLILLCLNYLLTYLTTYFLLTFICFLLFWHNVILFALYEIVLMMNIATSLLLMLRCTLTECANISGNLHAIQYIIYIFLLYGCGLNWYVHAILLVITILKDMDFCAYSMTIIYILQVSLMSFIGCSHLNTSSLNLHSQATNFVIIPTTM